MADVMEQFLSRLHHPMLANIDLKLERMQRLLSLLHNPQRRLPPVIHVAGTNGKGSLIAYLKAIFEAAGLRVHVYTSPHLVQFRERIVVQGKMIENAQIENIMKHVAPILAQQPATFFEATTALAFLAFAEKPADILLLETGLGGRLDATNVIEKPALTAIAPISFDHMEYLGDTLAKIAGEKAGIIKKNVACVVGRQVLEAAEVLDKKAAELGAPLFRLGQEWRVENHRYVSKRRDVALAPVLVGEHQYDNAATAVACIENLPQFSISDAQIAQGLANASWPARLQKLTHGGYIQHVPDGCELWLDGGHNAQGGEVLAAWLASRPELEKYLICGMVRGKDSAGFLAPVAKYTKALYAITIPEEATSQSADMLAGAARGVGLEAHVAASIEIALQTIGERAKTPSIICICGSLYLAGKVLAV